MRLKSYAAKSDQGPHLQLNEDGYEFSFEKDIFLVLDGYGGSGIGDRCVDKIKTEIIRYYGDLSIDPDATMPFYFNPKNILEVNALINALYKAHQIVVDENASRPLSQRSGASLIAGIKVGHLFITVSTGNCFGYQWRNGFLEKIIHEDSFKYLSKDKRDLKFKFIPLSGIGLYPELSYQIRELRILEGDKIVLATDGGVALLEHDEISSVLSRRDMSLQEQINSILKLSNSRGNTDNQSVVILEF